MIRRLTGWAILLVAWMLVSPVDAFTIVTSRFYVGSGGNFSDPNVWSFSDFGQPGAPVPVNGDQVTIDPRVINIFGGNPGPVVLDLSFMSPGLASLTLGGGGPNAILQQFANTMTVSGTLDLGPNQKDQGEYDLAGVTSALSAGVEIVGDSGTGLLNQSGGSNLVSGTLSVGNVAAGGSGTYALSGGLVSASFAQIGVSGSGTFMQTGGSSSFQNLILGNHNGSFGTYQQTGGNTTLGTLRIGIDAGSEGAYALSVGSLAVLKDEEIGVSGSGFFTQTGGSHSIGGSDYLGHLAGSFGSLAMTAGQLIINGDLIAGAQGTGRAEISGSATVSSANGDVGQIKGSTGSVSLGTNGELTPGGGTWNIKGNLYVSGSASGVGGIGSVTLSPNSVLTTGGTVTLYTSSTVTLNGGSWSTGTTTELKLGSRLNLNGGTFSTVDLINNGFISQAGGSLNVTGTMSGTGGLSFTGGTLSGGGTLSSPISITNALSVDNVTLTGTISGAGTLQKVGNGTTVLAGNNTYTGGTLINSGILSISNDVNLGQAPPTLSGNNVVINGGVLQAAQSLRIAGNRGIQIGPAGGFIDVPTAGATLVIPSAVTSSTAAGVLTKTGAGALAITGGFKVNSVNMTAGSLLFDAPSTANSLLITGGAVNARGGLNLGALTNNAGQFTSGGGNVTAQVVTLNGGATTVVGSAITTTAATRLAVPNLVATSTLGAVQLNVVSGTNTASVGGVFQVGSGGLIFIGNASPSITLDSDIAQPGLLLLGGDVNVTGTSGVAAITNSGPVPVPGSVDLSGGTRRFTVAAPSSALSISAQVMNGAVVKDGDGMLQLASANSYAGGTMLSGGTIEADDPGALGAGAIQFSTGMLALRSFSGPLASPLAVVNASNSMSLDVGSSAIQCVVQSIGTALNLGGAPGGSLTIASSVPLQSDLTITNSVPLIIDGQISGAHKLVAAGTSTLTLTGSTPNTWSGGTSANSGTLLLNKKGTTAIAGNLGIVGPGVVRLLASQQIAPTATITFDDTLGIPVLNVNGFSQTVAAINQTAGARIDLGNGSLTLAYGAGPDPDAVVQSLVTLGKGKSLGILSSTAGPNMVIGYLDNPITRTELIRTTLFGDINLDGKVNNSDYFQFNKSFGKAAGQSGFNPQFDFNGDGKVNNTDYFQFNKNFGMTFPGAAQAAFVTGPNATPEPAVLGLLGATILAGLALRRRY